MAAPDAFIGSAQCDLVLKIILIGDSGVGKSCVLKSFMGEAFEPTYISTIGVDFELKTVQHAGKTINLQLWDTAGQERFRTITTSYYRSADAILLCFDLTEEESFLNLQTWLEDVRLYSREGVCVMLLGCKVDLESQRVIDFERANAWASSQNMAYVETSAKRFVNVEQAFNRLTLLALDARESRKPRQSIIAVNVKAEPEGKAACSC
jgi:Ras-related protein Rab-1A